MVSYSGGKFRTGHLIAEVITKLANKYGAVGYCEPFCGMCSVMKHMDIDCQEYIASDYNACIIEMWKELQRGWIPPRHTELDRKLYKSLQTSDEVSAIRGFYLLHGNSGDWGHSITYSTTRPPIKTSDELVEIAKGLTDVDFESGDYTRFSHLKNWCVYTDPPYVDTYSLHRQPDGSTRFDHERFNQWCVQMAKDNLVIISAYVKPKIPCKRIYTCPIGRVRIGKALPLEKLYLVSA